MKFVSKNLEVNAKGHLTIGGVDVMYLKEKYKTPLYVMDENLIRENLSIYAKALEKYYDGNGMSLYASKAFCTKYMCKIVQEEGLGLDVVSGGELYTAIKAQFPMEKIYFHGNNKTYEEIEMAVENSVGRIVVDNIYELEQLQEISKKHDKIQGVLFRIKPGVDAHTHDFVKTGQIDSKFGFALETGEAKMIIQKCKEYANISYEGVHCHIGSQIFELEPFVETARIMMNFIKSIEVDCQQETRELNFGGGFGIKYTDADHPIQYDKFIKAVSEEVKFQCEKLSVKIPKIIMEPGRSIVASAGITLYTVGAVKEIPNIRTYISVDGGMTDNPRYIMYGSLYSAVIANKAEKKADKVYTVAGKCCESGDLLLENTKLCETSYGDTLAVLATGAYNFSMSSNYNRIPRPCVVMIKDKEDKLIVKRQTYDDIISLDL